MRFDIITIFPEMFASVFSGGIIKKALERGIVTIAVHDLRDYTEDKHRQVDDRPFGGLEGMVLKPEPIFRAAEAVREDAAARVYLLSPQGRRLDAALAEELASERQVVLVCGRYEGVDERVVDHLVDGEISIGDYVLSGGELAAEALGIQWRAHPFEAETYGGTNLLADVSGDADDPLLLLGAHWDQVSKGEGATDNASGSATVLALAQRLKQRPLKNHRLAVAFWDLEEKGLLGAKAFVSDGALRPKLYVNFDVFAWGDTVWMMTPDAAGTLATFSSKTSASQGLRLSAGERYPPTDHLPFLNGRLARGVVFDGPPGRNHADTGRLRWQDTADDAQGHARHPYPSRHDGEHRRRCGRARARCRRAGVAPWHLCNRFCCHMLAAQTVDEDEMAAHSNIVGGSTAKRVIACPGSVKLVQQMPPRPSSRYANEGTLCHTLMEGVLSQDRKPEDYLGDTLGGVTVTEELIDRKIRPALEALSEIDPNFDMTYECEVVVGFGDALPGVFGSADLIGRIGDPAVVLDWKFGDGVDVAVEENPQAMFYAAAAMRTPKVK